MKENLPRAKQQGAESAEQHRRKQNDAKAHTGNQVYSCGSLAPKLKKGKKGGCSDCEVCALRDMLLYHGGYNGTGRGNVDVDTSVGSCFLAVLLSPLQGPRGRFRWVGWFNGARGVGLK